MNKQPSLTWQKRRHIKRLPSGEYRRRYDTTKQYCICETASAFGLPFQVLAIEVTEYGERILSKHRSVAGAARALERVARRRGGPSRGSNAARSGSNAARKKKRSVKSAKGNKT